MKINFGEITKVASRAIHTAGFQLKKHSPEILVVSGVIGTVASAVMACKATTKVNFVLEETKEQIDVIHTGAKEGEVKGYLENGEVGMVPYTQEDSKKDLAIVYTHTGIKLIKLYGPSVALGVASIAGILVGHNILRKRNLALAAAYMVEHTGFKNYRGRLVERFGDKLDKELLYNIKAKDVEETVINEDGTESTVQKVVEVADPVAAYSPYTFCFDETANFWVRDAEKNKFFLLQQQDWANERLKSRGYLFLNEVLEMVGIAPCRMGQTVGWIYSKDNPIGDNYVDFGIFNIYSEASRNFVNGLEKSIWLTFNVDGDILNHL
jgi:hypothetical protein